MSGKVSTMYMSLLLGAIVVVGFSVVQGDVFANYGITPTDVSYLNATAQVINQTGNLKESIENTVITGIQPLDQFIASTYQTTKLLFGVVDIYDSFVSDAAGILGIPTEFSIVVTLIIAMVTLTVIFAIIRIVTHEET